METNVRDSSTGLLNEDSQPSYSISPMQSRLTIEALGIATVAHDIRSLPYLHSSYRMIVEINPPKVSRLLSKH